MNRAITFLFVVLASTTVSAADVSWKMRTVNPKSEFTSCAAFDIDHDGDVDIYSGNSWYEAPSWKQHKVRDVQTIRGRFDDYSNQTMDANGDGWMDVVSVNYRSETIYWIEHPGKNLRKQDWTAHVIDKPGSSETGRLHDIDGDGDLDILPNGTNFAAWYEFAPEKKPNGTLAPKWTKHELPREVAAHGLGIDRQTSLLTPSGRFDFTENRTRPIFRPYAEATPAPRLHSDSSVPIIPIHDGLLWARGHHTGLYAAAFLPGIASKLELRPIDTSWSQCHSPLLVDIDNDGEIDLVAGKRYMGHEGRDPGEYDPLVIYWYKYDKRRQTWTRNIVHEAGPAGMDLDPKATDIDGDGDVDLVAPSRNGLYWLENLLVNKQNVTPDQPKLAQALAAYKSHNQLLVHASDTGDLLPVKTPLEWSRRRWHILRSMEQVMGPLPNPSQRVPAKPEVKGEQPEARSEKYTIQRIQYFSEPGLNQDLPAYLLIPKVDLSRARLPAMLCLHPTSLPHGKKVVTGHVDAPNRNYAHELAERGYVCICPDYPTMGENPFDIKTTHKHYQSGTMKAIWDNIRCLDVLESLPYVDPDRIGVIGHSLGGHNGLFTACFDQRIKCVVTSCGFDPFHDYYGGKLAGWTQDRYMPRIRDVYESNPDKMPFDFYEVLGAIAPRGVFINAPLKDDNFKADGVKKAVAETQKVYNLLGQPNNLVVRYPDCGHDFPPEVREEVYGWLGRQLR